MTIGGKGVIMRETLIVILSGYEGSAPMVGNPKRQQRICYSVKERDSNGKNRDWVSLLVYKEVAGEAGRRILAWGNDAKE